MLKKLTDILKTHRTYDIVAIVLVILLIIGGIYYVDNHNKQTPAKFNAAMQKAVNKLHLGHYQAAINELNADKPVNSTERFEIDQQLGGIYFQEGKLNQALNYYIAAYRVSPGSTDDTTLAVIATIYMQQGNKAQAINYFNKAIAAVETPRYSQDAYKIPIFQEAIASLGK